MLFASPHIKVGPSCFLSFHWTMLLSLDGPPRETGMSKMPGGNPYVAPSALFSNVLSQVGVSMLTALLKRRHYTEVVQTCGSGSNPGARTSPATKAVNLSECRDPRSTRLTTNTDEIVCCPSYSVQSLAGSKAPFWPAR